MGYKAVLCDIDGVLVDSYALVRRCHCIVVKKYLGNAVDATWLDGLWGKGYREQLQYLFRVSGQDTRDISWESVYLSWRRTYARFHHVLAKPMAGAAGLLRDLDRIGVMVGVVSGRERDRIALACELLPEMKLAKVIISKDDVVRCKPDPEGVLLAVRRLRVGARETLFVGDSDSDVISGGAAGVDVFIVGTRISKSVLDANSSAIVGAAVSTEAWAQSILGLVSHKS